MKSNKVFLSALTVSTALLLGACSPTISQRGNILSDAQIAKVETGVHNRSDVLQLIGSPTTQAPFDPDVWYYIGQEKEKRGILDPEVVEERIVAVSFDEAGLVQFVGEIDNERINIPIDRDSTPTHGNELSLMQEFFGNLGRFNPQSTNQ